MLVLSFACVKSMPGEWRQGASGGGAGGFWRNWVVDRQHVRVLHFQGLLSKNGCMLYILIRYRRGLYLTKGLLFQSKKRPNINIYVYRTNSISEILISNILIFLRNNCKHQELKKYNVCLTKNNERKKKILQLIISLVCESTNPWISVPCALT